ncbi:MULTISPECIES: hypothetical protein [Staphylococcus]|nr:MULTISPECIES: hypothetical protein [Staphylococcus]MCS5193375.1 hypothetical protein [Staphylococcus aureus]MCT2554585.1 hypothetical protein [Staphylococcus aureus]MCT2556769.1 hypothetical protein [Staphylococcus aureus]MCT2567857.1 hypothetical protein [Staphylococcus aureus]MCT2572514.1 hypothetical protein [Staphylococcus aureus]
MNYEEIRTVLTSNDTYEVVKAIISFELGITDVGSVAKLNL